MTRFIVSLATCTFLLPATVFGQTPGTPAAPSQLEQSGLTAPTIVSQGFSASAENVLVTQLLGQTVFSSIGDDAEEMGTINDLVVTSGQGLSAVVIGVGGFLGVGTKDVAVDFSQLEWSERDDGSRRWVLAATTESLAAAPAFIWGDSEEATGEPALTPEEEEQQLVEGDPNAVPVDPTLTTDQPEAQGNSSALDRTGFSEFDETGLTAEELRGIGVYGINDELIGSIGDVLVNQDGSFDAVVIDVGGFLGLGAKPVAVGFDNPAFSADTLGNRYLFLNTTREQLESQTAYDPQTYEAQRSTQRMAITP